MSTRTRIVEAVLVVSALQMAVAGCAGRPEPDMDPDVLAHPGEHTEPAGDRMVHIDAEAAERLGLELAVAGPATLESVVELPGEVRVNGDRMAHVSPRVGGVVREVFASLGDRVGRGQRLAVLDSRELADAKAVYLAAAERRELAEAVFEREDRLRDQGVSSEQEFLDARRALSEARIELRAAEQKLHALGVPQARLDTLPGETDARLTSYELVAPFDGTVIERHITTGETLSPGSPVFTVADLTAVWIDLAVYQRDIGAVRDGQRVHVTTPHGDEVELRVDFVQPLVGESTRTATARIVAPNRDGIWHPGCFVTATVVTSESDAAVVIPASAVIASADGREVVFVPAAGGFELRPVVLGRRSPDRVEVLAGLEPGETYVAAGGFSLKAELGKDAFGDGHGH